MTLRSHRVISAFRYGEVEYTPYASFVPPSQTVADELIAAGCLSAPRGRLSEHLKADQALAPQSIASSNKTGAYFAIGDYAKAMWKISAAAMADAATVVAQVMVAEDAAATGATALTGAAATITGNVAVKRALLTGNTIVDEDTVVTVNGVVFSCEDTTPDAEAGEFASGANDTAACVNLAAVINSLCPELLATPSTSTVILDVRDPGTGTITIADAHATIVPSTLEAEAYVEVDHGQVEVGDFTHMALKLTTDDTIVVGAELIRIGNRDDGETQYMAAGTVL